MTCEIKRGSVAVVTGSASGIGLSIAKALADRGCQIAMADIDNETEEKEAALLREAGLIARAYKLDVKNLGDMRNFAEEVSEGLGPVSILVNNAGVSMRPSRAVWVAGIEDYRWMMEVNYFGVVNGILSFPPKMLGQDGHRHIVNTSSMASISDVPGYAMYAASKAAVDALSETLRAEIRDYGEDIGVTILYPGRVMTRIASSERLRAASDRSETRHVEPYPFPLPPAPHQEAIEPHKVGAMVVAAIEQNAPYCLTHPAPEDVLNARTQGKVRGYVEI